eukprot:INCI10222.3.p1 GENE.INCI10222.3~~INCI10222.3.p1  ORF type:complete len:477 (+),score=73.55 INCI10222.3:88-1518(+)
MPRRGGESGGKKRRPGANMRQGDCATVVAEAEQLFFSIQEFQEKLKEHQEQQQQEVNAKDKIQILRRQHYLKRFDGPAAPKSWDLKALREDFALLQARSNSLPKNSACGGGGGAKKRARRVKSQAQSSKASAGRASPRNDDGFDSLPLHVFALILEFLPAGPLARCRRLNSNWKSAADHVITNIRGYTQANDGLLTEFLLRTVLAPAARPGPERNATINRILAAVVQYGAEDHSLQWVLWGDDTPVVVKPHLAKFFFPDDSDAGRNDDHEESQLPHFSAKQRLEYGALDEDEAIGLTLSEDLRDSSAGSRFGHSCYAKEREAALKARDKLPATADAHGRTCGTCGRAKNGDVIVIYCADVAGRNLCADCLNATTVARVHVMLAHPDVFFFSSDVPTGPFPIPERLKGTQGIREGVFFSPGAQHTCFGIELWANPVFVGSGTTPALHHVENLKDLSSLAEPPNAYDTVLESGMYGGP